MSPTKQYYKIKLPEFLSCPKKHKKQLPLVEPVLVHFKAQGWVEISSILRGKRYHLCHSWTIFEN